MLARFERFLEQAVEGSLRRVFPTALQPVQLAKAAARAMERSQVVGVRGPEVPNRYTLRLSPADLERFGDYTGRLADEVAGYLVDYAEERGLRPVAQPRVELTADAAQPVGSVRAEARFADLQPPEQHAIDEAVAGTRRLQLADLAAARSSGAAAPGRAMSLVDATGARFALDAHSGILRLGRAPDNDVVLTNQRVSRYHAQLRWLEPEWLVYDLESTNGTWVDGVRVAGTKPRMLAPGQVLRLGDHELRVETDPLDGRV